MLTTLLTVWLLYVGAMISPGPNVLLVSQLAASSGRRTAWFAGLGVASGAAVWATCAVLGVHALFLAFPRLRLVLQVIGACYLLYLATRLWRSGVLPAARADACPSPLGAFRMGALTNLTNPKAALFFGSVFASSFPSHPSMLLQVAAIAVVFASALLWYSALSSLFSRNAVVQGYSRVSGMLGRGAALCFGAFGTGLLYNAARDSRS
jgi:threonine/homoserine/homoserine lactone efflux protein